MTAGTRRVRLQGQIARCRHDAENSESQGAKGGVSDVGVKTSS